MNSAGKVAVLILLTALVAGCTHKAKTTPPPAAQAPVIPVSTLTKNTPPPQLPPAKLPKINPPGSDNTASNNPEPKSHKPARHKPKHPVETTPAETVSAKDQTPTPAQAAPPPTTPPQQASTGAATDVSPIGQLSAAGDSNNTPGRQDILVEINSIETGLNSIKRTLTNEEQVTATQIRTFLAKAKDALKQEDLEGAHTLVTKARVLMDELTKE